MSSLSDLYIKKETLETMLKVLNQKGEKGISITASINDESNQYGQNISVYVSQSKEDRDAGKQKFYVGNGRVFWTDGKIIKGEKKEEGQQSANTSSTDTGELPF